MSPYRVIVGSKIGNKNNKVLQTMMPAKDDGCSLKRILIVEKQNPLPEFQNAVGLKSLAYEKATSENSSIKQEYVIRKSKKGTYQMSKKLMSSKNGKYTNVLDGIRLQSECLEAAMKDYISHRKIVLKEVV